MIKWPDMDRVVRCIADAETGDQPAATRDRTVGDGGDALGRHQCWKVFVDEVNRIMKEAARRNHRKFKPYRYEDRTDAVLSADMTAIHARYWGERMPDDCKVPEAVFARNLQRIHNGGPTGYLKPETEKIAKRFDRYWSQSA